MIAGVEQLVESVIYFPVNITSSAERKAGSATTILREIIAVKAPFK